MVLGLVVTGVPTLTVAEVPVICMAAVLAMADVSSLFIPLLMAVLMVYVVHVFINFCL